MKLPKSWADVTVPQLIELEAINNDESLKSEPYPDITKALLTLSLFSGESYEFLEGQPISYWKPQLKKLAFLDSMPSERAVQKFRSGGYTWRVNFDLKKLSAGEYIDLYELTKDKTIILQNSGKILSLFCTPCNLFGQKVNIDKLKKQELLYNAPVNVVYPLTVFFCNLLKAYTEIIEGYLISLNQKANQEMKELKKQATTTA